MPGQHFRPPLPVGPRPQMVAGGHQVQPGSENRTQMLLQQRQPPPNTVDNQVNQVTVGSEVGNKRISLQIIFLREILLPAPVISLKATLTSV